jgi:hypothetical protein
VIRSRRCTVLGEKRRSGRSVAADRAASVTCAPAAHCGQPVDRRERTSGQPRDLTERELTAGCNTAHVRLPNTVAGCLPSSRSFIHRVAKHRAPPASDHAVPLLVAPSCIGMTPVPSRRRRIGRQAPVGPGPLPLWCGTAGPRGRCAGGAGTSAVDFVRRQKCAATDSGRRQLVKWSSSGRSGRTRGARRSTNH